MSEKPDQQLEEGTILSRETLDLLTLEEAELHGSHAGMVGDDPHRHRKILEKAARYSPAGLTWKQGRKGKPPRKRLFDLGPDVACVLDGSEPLSDKGPEGVLTIEAED